VLQAGRYIAGDVAATIEQTGLIPVGTQSIQAKFSVGATDFTVSLNGQNIPMSPLASASAFTLFGGDVSAFAGQTVDLSISALSVSPQNTFNIVSVDSIVFSTTAVPEPETWALLLCGAVLFGFGGGIRSGSRGGSVRA